MSPWPVFILLATGLSLLVVAFFHDLDVVNERTGPPVAVHKTDVR